MSKHTDETPGEAGERAARDDARVAGLWLRKAQFVKERMRQEGCLAIEAAKRWEAGER